MQIHELNTFTGTPGSGDYLAIDDGDETMKVPASNLGVTDAMTQAEAEAGTGTGKRVITPKVLHDYVTDTMGEMLDPFNEELNDLEIAVEELKILKVSKSSVSSLPTTITNSKIKSDMEVIHSVLSNPAAQTGDWTVTTSNGSLTIAGTISGTTNITLYLASPRT